MRGPSPVAASGGHSSSRCAGLSLSRPLLLRSTGSRCAGSVVVAHGPSRPEACGIFPDQGLNPCPLHWQADPQPLRHQGSTWRKYFKVWSLPLNTSVGISKNYRHFPHNRDAMVNEINHDSLISPNMQPIFAFPGCPQNVFHPCFVLTSNQTGMLFAISLGSFLFKIYFIEV